MRLGFRATLLLFAGFAILMGALALGIDSWMRSVEETTGRAAVRLLAGEKAAMLSQSRMSEALSRDDPSSRERLREQLETIARQSALVSSVAVVNAEGRVVMGDGLGQPAPQPAAVFVHENHDIKIDPLEPLSFFAGGSCAAYLPLEERGVLVGYVRLTFRGQGQHLAGFYREARRQLLVIGLLGLLGVGFLGLLLQYQLARGAATIERALDETAPPPSLLSTGDEFSRTLATAARVRKALNEARRETGRMHQGFSALAQVMQVGVLLLRGDRSLDFANPRALELLGSKDPEALQAVWDGARSLLVPVFERARLKPVGGAAKIDLPLREGNRSLRVEVYRLGGEDCDEYLILLNDPQILETLESDVRLASQLEGLARTYRTVAHELKAPLSAVMINLDLLRESLIVSEPEDEGVKERQKRYVSILREEFARLNRSLGELLTQTTPPNEAQRPFDLVQLIRELGTLLAPQARRYGVDLALRLPEEKLTLVGYRDRLKQALLNIAVNALEAMPTGGRVGIEVEVQKGRARVRVSDAGAGIPPELLPRIYESDFTTKGGGSGIGLYVARALVQLHGGQIDVESELGRGTQVTVELPLVRPT